MAHPLVALLGQRILGLALGYEDVNDHDELRRDRALSTAMGRVECARSDCEPLAGKSTLNRMELSANGRAPAKAHQITVDFDALDELLVELYLVWGERGQMPKRLVLDIDATDVELHGRQEHRFYHGYYSNSPYSFILGLMSVFSCFGTGNRRFQTVCTACRCALERVPGIDMQVS